MPTDIPVPSTRDRLVAAMTDALQRRGLHGIGLTELLQAAQAPKGVLYHHFPGGKTELAVAAIDAAVLAMGERLDALMLREADPLAALRAWLAGAQRQLERSGFASGCPLATVALESTPDDAALRDALARAFASLRDRLAALLLRAGLPASRTPALAALLVAAYEGALMQARVAGDAGRLADISNTLLDLVARELSELCEPSESGVPREPTFRPAPP
jgi:TetR/AcrR family transcriptional repressor of lmrAB and yxaGH operons